MRNIDDRCDLPQCHPVTNGPAVVDLRKTFERYLDDLLRISLAYPPLIVPEQKVGRLII